MIYLVAFVVLVLATARLTRFICKDDITTPVRLALDRKLGEQSFISRLIWCHWCVAVWISLGTSSMAMQAVYAWGGVSPKVAVLSWLLLIPANAYAASGVVDKEGE
jgi:hypothetical protein